MASSHTYRVAGFVALIAILYQFLFKRIIFDVAGFGRPISPIETHNATCERIDNLGIEACEDMWFHHASGYLYMACSDVQSRLQWLPAADRLNASGRGLTDRIAILDTRGSGSLESRLKWMTTDNFSGNNGDGTFNLHGFDIRLDPKSDTLSLLLINHRPPINPVTGVSLDAVGLGANSTIELFQSHVGSDSMRHVRTYTDPAIQTPNQVAWVNDNAFVFTNDHSAKRRHLDILLGGGSVGYCDSHKNLCNIAHSNGFTGPNGVDENGDIVAASFPQAYKWAQSLDDQSIKVPAAVVRIRRKGNDFDRLNRGQAKEKKGLGKSEKGYFVETVVEDDGGILSAVTTVVHDARKGKFYLGGITAPFIMTCEMKK
ncbi:hypothetical protein EYC84_003246 [Monilinia fructicola]|uniref:Calcium-dependent phosphotriesterase n=1 Tax=Monilinia fructicola TaxID=38448 RepID=A0A5M9JTX3_MONFR|nr:hypothetical protein EYC84_003246 [Monilinia fructicola]